MGVMLSVLLPYKCFSVSLPKEPCLAMRFRNVGAIFFSTASVSVDVTLQSKGS